jgi:hypothetical protein
MTWLKVLSQHTLRKTTKDPVPGRDLNQKPYEYVECFVIPVITGATGIVTRGLKNIWKRYQESIQ